MRQVTEKVIELILKFRAGDGLLGPVLRQTSLRRQVLAEIGTSRELAAIEFLVGIWLEWSELAADSMRAISQLLASASDKELLEVDDEMRQSWSWDFPRSWRQINPDGVARIANDSQSPAACLGVLSSHPNGQVREQAVRELGLIRDGSEVPFLLIRLNDWVESIRREARHGVVERLEQGRIAPFFDHLYLILRLEDCHRDDHSKVIDRVVQSLIAPDSGAMLSAALANPGPYVRRKCYRLGMNIAGSHQSEMIRDCLRSDDVVLRLWASRDARKVLPVRELESAVHAMLGDSFMPVRREALLTLMERFPEQAPAAVENALFEPVFSMREFARFHLCKFGRGDKLAESYREAVRKGRSLPGAVAGLGEVGASDDVPLIKPYLQSSPARVRAAAIRAFGALAADREVSLPLQLLQDESNLVSREAAIALKWRLDHVSIPELWSIFQTNKRMPVRLAVLGLLEEVDTWRVMPYFVVAAADDEERIAEYVQERVLARMNRVFTKPTVQQRRAIEEKLDLVAVRSAAFVYECRKWLAARS